MIQLLHLESSDIEVAEGGTVFLDEVEALPLDLQRRLPAAIEERSALRLGAAESTPHDARVIITTHVDLDEAVRHGTFRADLLDCFRLSMVALPPLRERPDDSLPLARYFMGRFARHHGGCAAAHHRRRGALTSLSLARATSVCSERAPATVARFLPSP